MTGAFMKDAGSLVAKARRSADAASEQGQWTERDEAFANYMEAIVWALLAVAAETS